ncbi:MAG TPA: squalene synthase HpnC, partial [Streptosporangiaceae bacterium]
GPACEPAEPVSLESVAAVTAKAAHENFPVALRMVPRRYRQSLMAVYVYARTVDDVGDRAPAADRPRLLAELERDVGRLYAGLGTGGEPPRLAAVRGLARTVRDCDIPPEPLIDLIRANQQDQVVTRYQTYADLAGYCELSANPVGRIVLRIFGCYTDARAGQSDQICTGLQLAEHWQDVAEDLRAGRIYLPLDDLAAHGCTETDLAEATAGPAVRRLMAAEVTRARGLIDAGAPLVGSLRGAARAAVAGYVAGGRAALAAIAAADYDVLSATRRPGRARTAAELLAAYARGR